MPFTTGTVLNNRYRIVKLLGQGGFGAVYRAWDMNLERPVALKENLETGEAAERQFKRETKMLVELMHPHLPRVFDYFSLPGQGQYLVMDYVEGEDLEQKLQMRAAPLEEKQVLEWIVQICDALVYLHSQQPPIIHRDIKPANIRITPEGKAYLVDFGIAKVYDPQKRTTVGARAVTPGYAPFEQYGGKTTDARSDVYALGATMYHLLTGVLPPESIDRIAGVELRPIRQLNPHISPVTEACVMRAMAIMPEGRYASIKELQSELQRCLEAIETPPTQRVVLTSQRGEILAGDTVVAPPAPLLRGAKEVVLKLSPEVEMVFMHVPAGEFLMGSEESDQYADKDEKPQHKVYLDEYWLGKYPVTNAQYKVFVDVSGHAPPLHWKRGAVPKGREDHPVVNVSWHDASAFCTWLSRATGEKIRLPSEAEWEKAARGTDGRLYPWGNNPPSKKLCNYGGLIIGTTTPVGRYSPQGDSPYECADMVGNVWEWVLDWYSETFYSKSPYKNPMGPASGKYRVLRGGSWSNYVVDFLRVAYRVNSSPEGTFNYFGFRCARFP